MTSHTLHEVALLESQLNRFYAEDALEMMMKNKVIANMILREEKKIIKYSLQKGIVKSDQLNEGMWADIGLTAGQMLGSIPGLAEFGVGAAFGAAGVLWYGNEMLNSKGFERAMNLVFCVFSAAAIEPTGVFGETAALGKVMKPFVQLGEWARGVLGMKAVTQGGKALEMVTEKLTAQQTEALKAAVESLNAAEKTVAKAAATPQTKSFLIRAIDWVSETVIKAVKKIFESIGGIIARLPGAELFGKISEVVVKGAKDAWAWIKTSLVALMKLGEVAPGAEAAAKTAAAGAEAAAPAAAQTGVAAAEPLVAQVISAPNVQQAMQTAAGAWNQARGLRTAAGLAKWASSK
jgi:hypothetical protein